MGVQGAFGGAGEVLGEMGKFWECRGAFGGPRKIWQGAGGRFWGADIPLPFPPPPRELEGDVFVELDVGSEGNGDEAQLGGVLRDLVAAGSIASYLTSPLGFQFRRLGAGECWGGTHLGGGCALRPPP